MSDESVLWNAERQRLEGEVFRAVNNLIHHTGSSSFVLPGRINSVLAVYVGDPDQVVSLAIGQGAGPVSA